MNSEERLLIYATEISSCNIEILHIHDQNHTDFEKCLQILRERKLFPCLVYGATGKESDHTLYNLSLMAEQAALDHANVMTHNVLTQQIIFHDSAYQEREKYGIFVTSKLCGVLPIGAKISLMAFSPSVVSTIGLQWELSHKALSIDVPKNSSVRNVVRSAAVEITVHHGNVLVLFDL
jgi:thiamine pyrophosphokinase